MAEWPLAALQAPKAQRIAFGGGLALRFGAAEQRSSRPQFRSITILIGKRTRVRFPIPPPLPQVPTLIGWDFFRPERQHWRGSPVFSVDCHPAGTPAFGAKPPRFLSLFSVPLLTVTTPGPGLARVCGRRAVILNWSAQATDDGNSLHSSGRAAPSHLHHRGGDGAACGSFTIDTGQ